jgi:hypothetical protein
VRFGRVHNKLSKSYQISSKKTKPFFAFVGIMFYTYTVHTVNEVFMDQIVISKKFRFTEDQLKAIADLKRATGAKTETMVIRLALDMLHREFIGEDFPPSNRTGWQRGETREIRVNCENGLGQLVLIGQNAPVENAINSVFRASVKATVKEG